MGFHKFDAKNVLIRLTFGTFGTRTESVTAVKVGLFNQFVTSNLGPRLLPAAALPLLWNPRQFREAALCMIHDVTH